MSIFYIQSLEKGRVSVTLVCSISFELDPLFNLPKKPTGEFLPCYDSISALNCGGKPQPHRKELHFVFYFLCMQN